MESMLDSPHASAAAEVAVALEVDPARGLAANAVSARRVRYGPNAIVREKGRPAWRIFVRQFASIVVALLAVAAAVAFFTNDPVEAAAIVAVLLINALVGFAIEWQSQRALEKLRLEIRMTARVRREGSESMVDAVELVPGDVILLDAGSHVPADARVLDAAGLAIDEAALTGESLPVGKSAPPVSIDTPLAERVSMAYLGTHVVSGRGTAIVTATGDASEMGKIGSLMREVVFEATPLEQKLAKLGRQLVTIVVGIGTVVAVAGILRGIGIWEMVEVGITLAVAAVPEGLPAVTTLILALGVVRMARRHALVRRLPTVETLGSTTVICTDKTGTLTMNRLAVRSIDAADPAALLRVAVLCNSATEAGIGDPTEVALLTAARERGVDVDALRRAHPLRDEVPFDPATRMMITTHDGGYVAMKGAPSVVLEACALGDAERAQLMARNEALASDGLRILAFAEGQTGKPRFTFLGFAALADPPRPGAAEAVAKAHDAGIRVVMLTGDQVATARAITRELRLSGDREPLVVHARELASRDAAQVHELASRADAFARVTPEEKLRIVAALRDAGEVVAVTGDGINDAPALRRADIGVAMGGIGTDVAKSSADLILTDDNLGTIVAAVEEGRTIFANITKFVHLMFSHNLGEVIVVFAAIVAGLPLPLLPLQILWMNVVTDIFPAFAVALEPPLPRRMREPPRSASAILSRPFLWLIAWQGVMLAAVALAAYGWALARYGAGAHARTIALTVLVAVQMGHTFNCRSRTESAFAGLARNPHLWAATATVIAFQVAALTFTPLRRILDTTPLTRLDAAVVLVCGILPVAIVELYKRAIRPPVPIASEAKG
jgi:Ca2+-transporting ATPase